MYMSQVQEGKSFLHQGQICLMELIEGVLQDKTQYRLFGLGIALERCDPLLAFRQSRHVRLHRLALRTRGR